MSAIDPLIKFSCRPCESVHTFEMSLDSWIAPVRLDVLVLASSVNSGSRPTCGVLVEMTISPPSVRSDGKSFGSVVDRTSTLIVMVRLIRSSGLSNTETSILNLLVCNGTATERLRLTICGKLCRPADNVSAY